MPRPSARLSARHFVPAMSLLILAAGCYRVKSPPAETLASFKVEITGIYSVATGSRTALPVVSACATHYGGAVLVPANVKGTQACPYHIVRGDIDIDVTATALTRAGEPTADFNGYVAWKAVPGTLTGDYDKRWATAIAGQVSGTVRVAHLFGEVRIWAEDAPVALTYLDGGIGGTLVLLPPDMLNGDSVVQPENLTRTYASGLSPTLYFDEPTLQKLQLPETDNRGSPFEGEFITVGKEEGSRESLLQSCSDDPTNDGKEAMMVVTGTDQSGFFVTDITACKVKESIFTNALKFIDEPSGFMPGTFGSMYVYNYSHPEGLAKGDLLFTLAGAVQEFTSTTQLTFPSLSVRERVFRLPEAEQDKYLKQVPVPDLNGRICGVSNNPFLTDEMCGHSARYFKIESLESALVRLPNVRFPERFKACDFNGDGDVPFFCEHTRDMPMFWGSCDFSGAAEPANEVAERQCNIDCITGQGEHQGKRCAEEATFVGFGQFPVEMNAPGLASAHLDDSLTMRFTEFPVTATSSQAPLAPTPPSVVLACNVDVRWKSGDAPVVAGPADALLKANTPLYGDAGSVGAIAVITAGAATPQAKCSIAENPRIKINLVTKDAIPELKPFCHEDDADAERAAQCKMLHAATFDVVGHLRHVQPARPRWTVFPRGPDDLCCHPGPGLACPKPIRTCPQP